MDQKDENSVVAKFKRTRFYRIANALASSVFIGFVITILFFAFEMYFGHKQFNETADRLDNISRSLSTRCLGKFPGYIAEINEIFSNLQAGDTVIIFEDVLYYGIKSDPVGFCKLQQHLLNHSRQGGKVIVAYYDNHVKNANLPWQTTFHRMIIESRIATKYLPLIPAERHKRLEKLAEQNQPQTHVNSQERIKMFAYIDSCVTEEFFRLTCDNDHETAQQVVDGYITFTDVIKKDESTTVLQDAVINNLCNAIDSIMRQYLVKSVDKKKKNIDDIHFADYEKMYSDITDCIAECYTYHRIELLPLNEYLTMSCWLIKPANKSRSVETILAFPSKYSSEEIGFYSQDELFSEYITTILNGVHGDMNSAERKSSIF